MVYLEPVCNITERGGGDTSANSEFWQPLLSTAISRTLKVANRCCKLLYTSTTMEVDNHRGHRNC